MGPVTVVWDEALAGYDLGPSHPLRPERAQLTMALARACGLLDGADVVPPRPPVATDLTRVHDEAYIAAVRAAGEDLRPAPVHGLGPGDNPPFPRMHEASALVTAATVSAAEAVLAGRALHAFSPAGGLHHAMPDRAGGFCIYNDPAAAIAWMLEQGVGRVAYVDVDVHHGDGVEAIFAGEPRVLTISVHESGRYLFPGTGDSGDVGTGAALGTMANLPLPPLTPDGLYLDAFDAVVPPLVRAFQPEVLITQLGCDSHHTDPLAHLALTTGAYRELAVRLHELAHAVAGGRWLATGGGGYRWAEVVPRAWCTYLAEMVGQGLPEELPAGYRAEVEARHGVRLDPRMADPPIQIPADRQAGVASQVEQAVEATRRHFRGQL